MTKTSSSVLYMQDAKAKAVEKRGQGVSYFKKKKYDLAMPKFTEAILLLPRIPENTETMLKLYWERAECYRHKV